MSVSTCENPQFPNFAWRYNRNKHLMPYENWTTRVEQSYPNYRHMGMHYGFQFTPCASGTRGQQELGVTCAKEATWGRQAGFGNAALGLPPGPTPPKMKVYSCPSSMPRTELYRINEVSGCSGGVSLVDRSYKSPQEGVLQEPAMHPKSYLKQTLNQDIEYHCQYPHFQLAREPLAPMAQHSLIRKVTCEPRRSPLQLWREKNKMRELRDAQTMSASIPRILPSIEPGAPRPATSALVLHHKADGDSRWPYPLANF